MVTKLLRTYGVDDSQDTELTAVAKDFLDDAVKDMNSHLYEFNRLSETIDLQADDNNYPLTNTDADGTDGSTIVPYKESYAYLIDADGNRLPLTYLPWVRFAERLGNTFYSNSGPPELYSFKNIENDGKVYVWPTPGDLTYDMVIDFYRRIPLYSDLTNSTTSPNMPEEVETPLFYNALKRLAIHLYGPGHKDVEGFDALESKALTELKAVDKRHPDQQQRFVVSDFRNRNRSAGRRSLYIKV
jgi:hypothetical protein